MRISKLATGVPESVTLAVTAKAKQLKAEGVSVISFAAGEPDFDTPEFIKDAAKVALDEGKTKYTAASGISQLKEAICRKLQRENGVSYSPENVIVSSGAKSSLYLAMLACLDEGDDVIIPSPYWVTYPELVKICGAKPVFVETKNSGYKMTAQSFSSAITKKTKMLVLNTPCNPTGTVYDKALLKEIGKIAVENDIFILSDEVYEQLVYGVEHVSIASLGEQIKKQTITVNGMSKSFAMTGWRVGYAAADKEIIKAMAGLQSHTAGNTCSIAQYASVAAFIGGGKFEKDERDVFAKRRDLIVSLAEKLENVTFVRPDGAFYLYMNVSAYYGKKWGNKPVIDSILFSQALLDNGVAVIPCKPFGDDNCIRLSYAIGEDEIAEGLKRISDFLKKLK